MKRKSKSIKVGCFLLCIFFLTISTPMTEAKHVIEKTMEKQVVTTDGKPDFIIVAIWQGARGDAQNIRVLGAGVQNIGNASAVGDIDFSYTIRRLPSLIIVRSHTGYSYVEWIPGGGIPFYIGETQYLPKFGFFRVTCEVNPGRLINESNYDNNKGAQNFLVFFGYWLAIG